jgi:hypothetical protein
VQERKFSEARHIYPMIHEELVKFKERAASQKKGIN